MKSFLLRQRMCVSDEVTILSDIISINFAKSMFYVRDISDLTEIFKR